MVDACTGWYTSQCTFSMPSPATPAQRPTGPLTLADWRAAVRGGASVTELVRQRLAQAVQPRATAGGEAAADPAWILPPTSPVMQAHIEARLAELEALCAAMPDRAALLARWPLFGVPFAVKDNIDVAGLPTSAACPAFVHTAELSATVVTKLLAAGAVLIGKTNLDQFATGLVGTRSPYGQPTSTWSADHVSGGSSSGSAVLVSRGTLPFALGTDTAGSGRVPAGFNHIVGLKPTPGRVSTAGVLPACRSLDCVSVFALTAADAAAVLAAIEGDDAADAYSRFSPGIAGWNHALRIGVPRPPRLDAAQGGAAAWAAAERLAQELGATLVPVDFEPLHAVAQLLYDGPWVAERHTVVQALLDADPAALDATVAAVIAQARGFDATDTFRAMYRLQAARRDTAALWGQVDLLMVPTAPRHPTLAEVAAAPVAANAELGAYTNFVNFLGWCALALPATRTEAGLPFGVTFIGPADADAALAGFGQRWQAAAAQPLGATGAALPAPEAHADGPRPAVQPELHLAVVGAHLEGLPLNGQLLERGARLVARTHTAPAYRLYALPGTTPRKPGLQRVAEGGTAIAVEVWSMPQRELGGFLALIPPPLGLGSLELADGRHVHGFLCEAHALAGATDISHHGGWRAYLASL
jgi:allophanate hydrolase